MDGRNSVSVTIYAIYANAKQENIILTVFKHSVDVLSLSSKVHNLTTSKSKYSSMTASLESDSTLKAVYK